MSDSSQDKSTQDDQDQNDGSDNQDGSQNDGSKGSGGSNDSSSDGQKKDKNWLEWSVTIAGAAIVLFVLGFLIYQYGWGSDEPADITVELGTPTTSGGTVEVPVTVRNTGDRVASAAVVEICAGPDTCAQLTFDYLPFASKRTGSVGFTAPASGPFETRIVSYRDP